MKRSVRIISLVLAFVIMAGLVTGVAIWSANYEAPTEQKYEPGVYIDGQRVADPGVILTVGEHDILFPEYRQIYYSVKDYVTMMYGAEYWESDPDGDRAYYLASSIENTFKETYAWGAIAAEMGIELTEEEKQSTLDTIAEQKASLEGGDAEWAERAYALDEEDYVRVVNMQKLALKTQTELSAQLQQENEGELTSGIMTAEHILIPFNEEEEDKTVAEAEALETAAQILYEINAAEDPEAEFKTQRALYQDNDPGQPDEGYTFTKDLFISENGNGKMADEFSAGTAALKVGEISQPIHTEFGYHIIHRLPLNEANVEENYDTYVGDVINRLSAQRLEEEKEKLSIEGGEYYDRIRLNLETIH